MHRDTTLEQMPQRNNETGRYTASYPPKRFIDALDDLDGEGTTQDVRERVGCAYRTAHARLSELEANDQITSLSVGRAKLWRLLDDGTKQERGTKDGEASA